MRTWTMIHRIAAAEAMRAHRDLGIDTTRMIDPFLALERSGVIVMRQPLDRLAGAYLPGSSTDGGRPGVLINVGHPLSRQRYTAAHELWHHRRDQDFVLDDDTEWLARGEAAPSERERLAESFASWFLMPMQLVRPTLNRLGATARTINEQIAYALSLELGTSYSATVRHLHGLKLITSALRDRLLQTTPQTIKQMLGEMDAAADPWKDIHFIASTEQTRAVAALEGDVVVWELPEIPSSGYRWQPAPLPDFVTLIRDEYRSIAPNVLGGNGVHRFVFSVQARGRRNIRLELGRPWLPGRAAEVRDVDVTAQPKPASGVFNPTVLVGAAA